MKLEAGLYVLLANQMLMGPIIDDGEDVFCFAGEYRWYSNGTQESDSGKHDPELQVVQTFRLKITAIELVKHE